ncbi:DUF1549 and DUF1553 domain-containing protein [Verrucomicrobia bacterium]|nr:DUF1549 and DUF1553 domain-containing protein [Verrucomicrobiota bacterium]
MKSLVTGMLLLTSSVGMSHADDVSSSSNHWAFQSPLRPELPMTANPRWASNPIDRFVLDGLKRRGLSASPKADTRILLRRLSFDLRGLPPSPEEFGRFESEWNQAAYRRLLERWLASPEFGEHMAQEWLDAARYADTAGHAADVPRMNWLYRDWVINALNRNMPFDQFTIEQLAGDMIPGATRAQRIATGFHRNSMQALGNNPRKEEFRVKGIVDRVETTGRVWLGLTVACAECHDHKFDPISTEEYYRMFAVFNNVPHLGQKFQVHGPRLEIRNERDQKEWDRYESLILEKRGVLRSLTEAEESERKNGEIEQLNKEIKKAENAKKAISDRTLIAQVMEELPEPRKTFVHIRGNFENPGKQVVPGLPAFLPVIPEGEAVNRLSFARWLVDGRNPLTARVMVNRIWAHYFGQGLVPTVDDFGSQGDPPSHPDLLDWLAVEFVESGWDMKGLHRLIVTSETYQQSSRRRLELEELDPGNRWLARGPRLRLSAEQIRDQALTVSGLMTDRIGGPSVFPLQPGGVGEFRDATAGTWVTSEGGGRYRRSLYTFWQRTSPYPGLTILDATSRERSCVRRTPTNTPLQALLLLNDPAYVEMADALAQRVIDLVGDFEARLEYGFQLVLGREPEFDERGRFAAFDGELGRAGKMDERERWRSIVQVLLNLDETITKE